MKFWVVIPEGQIPGSSLRDTLIEFARNGEIFDKYEDAKKSLRESWELEVENCLLFEVNVEKKGGTRIGKSYTRRRGS